MSLEATDHPAVRQLQPTALWNRFTDLNRVPRASKREQQVTQFAADFGRRLGLETIVDSVGNVIIRKPATPGMERRTPVILQSHLDMVHQKNQATQFDFATQGIQMVVREDWVWAVDTTLGADNGIGVAAIMAILESTEIAHPALEALLTVDEETGMTGAKGLAAGQLRGQILLNLDTEEDDELTIGCAGGVDVSAMGTFATDPVPRSRVTPLRLNLGGLKGGHSGMDIHLGRANANKLLARLLWNAAGLFDLRLQTLDGGSLRNAIPREAWAVAFVPDPHVDPCLAWIADQAAAIRREFADTDPGMVIECQVLDAAVAGMGAAAVLSPEAQTRLLAALYACPNGVARMSPSIAGLVETSNNVARVTLNDGHWQVGCLTRSSINSARDDLARAVAALWEAAGCSTNFSGDYPGWQPQPDSPIVRLMDALHTELFGGPTKVSACHGGLECGILGAKYPDVQMISFGPNIRGAHSPEERVQISSVQKFWRYLLATLERIPPQS
jgi:dipeptidase D